MCILRLRYPEVYQSMYLNKYKYLTSSQGYGFSEVETGNLYLGFKDKDESNLEGTELYHVINKNTTRFAINQLDVIEVVKLIDLIFGRKNYGIGYRKSRTL